MTSTSTIYHYHPVTGEFLGKSEADLDPEATRLAGEPCYLYPAHCTLDAPPKPKKGNAARFVNGTWTQVEDHRGKTVYDTETGSESVVNEIGPLPDGVTLSARPSEAHRFRNGRWTEDAGLKAEIDKRQHNAVAQEAARRRIATLPADQLTVADLAVAIGLRAAS